MANGQRPEDKPPWNYSPSEEDIKAANKAAITSQKYKRDKSGGYSPK
jgi:hypothetical protein